MFESKNKLADRARSWRNRWDFSWYLALEFSAGYTYSLRTVASWKKRQRNTVRTLIFYALYSFIDHSPFFSLGFLTSFFFFPFNITTSDEELRCWRCQNCFLFSSGRFRFISFKKCNYCDLYVVWVGDVGIIIALVHSDYYDFLLACSYARLLFSWSLM